MKYRYDVYHTIEGQRHLVFTSEQTSYMQVIGVGQVIVVTTLGMANLPQFEIKTQDELDAHLSDVAMTAQWAMGMEVQGSSVKPKDETAYLLSTPANAAHLEKSMSQLGAKLVERDEEGRIKPTMAELTGTKEGFAENYDQKGSATHYNDIIPGFQYIDMMHYMLARFTGVEAHLMGQIYKYLMRCGKKDKTVQELTKVQWYLNYLIDWHKKGCCPFSKDQLRELAARMEADGLDE